MKEGDIVKISDILFTNYRDYLVKYNGELVKAHQLAGKVLVIYFVSISSDFERGHLPTAQLIDTYNGVPLKSSFEVVLVAIGDDPSDNGPLHPWLTKEPQGRFTEIFSRMPWIAIPYSDKPSRERLDRRFGLSKFSYVLPSSFIIDPTGKVLHCHAGTLFACFGAEGFPFSYERLALVDSQDEAAAKKPTLKTLLASPTRDYVISNKGNKVSIGDLEGKVVALYLFEHCNTTNLLTGKLIMAYEQLKKRGEEFEVVLVNLHSPSKSYTSNEESFWKIFKSMPWLALPFEDWNCRKLERIFDYPDELGGPRPDPTLVIIGPNGEFADPFGADILEEYGVAAYPFTREKVVKMETERVKKLKLDSLWDPNVVLLRKDGSQVRFSELIGKRILFFVEKGTYAYKQTEFLVMLRHRYIQKKGKSDEFEVIHICSACKEDRYNEFVADLPWLVHPFCEDVSYAEKILYPVFKVILGQGCALVAFERDGSLITKAEHTKFTVMEDMEFPFADDLEKETFIHLCYHNDWDYYDEEYEYHPSNI